MDFQGALGKKVLFLDGGMGTLLQARGLKPGELPETWNVNRPEDVMAIHRDYLDAGADIILANTFGANGIKYKENLEELVTAGVQNAKKVVAECGREAFVALDMGPTGKLLKPMGTLDFEDAVALYREVASIGAKAGADLIVIETMSDTYELKAAVLGAKEGADLPIIATVVFGDGGKMLTGASPEAVVALLEGMQVDVIGMNCSLGPKQMKPIFEKMAAVASIPLVISPNAGLPRTENGHTVYDVTAKGFAEIMEELVHMGAWIVGGCCGTTPEHIKETVDKCRDLEVKPLTDKNITMVSSYSQVVAFSEEEVIIGDCLNPAKEPEAKEALEDHDLDYVLDEADAQVDDGAEILGISVDVPGIDQVQMIEDVIIELQSLNDTPLQIKTSDIAVMEKAMRIYNGKPMIYSAIDKAEELEQVFALVQKYGAAVMLSLQDGDPFAIAEKYGIARKDILMDTPDGEKLWKNL